ncbi:MAG: hypothetical protein PHW69_08020 [Elusimicrobiaceae bacterium]|nr:hypothetical protein [Elusimicrobiaceae bacterium]
MGARQLIVSRWDLKAGAMPSTARPRGQPKNRDTAFADFWGIPPSPPDFANIYKHWRNRHNGGLMKNLSMLFIVLMLVSSIAESKNNAPVNYAEFLANNGQPPIEFVCGKFKQYPIVLLGEYHKIKQQVDVVKNLIQPLTQAGITTLVFEFGDYRLQSKLDELLKADKFDENVVNLILKSVDKPLGWGYREYADIFKEVWKINRETPTVYVNILLGNYEMDNDEAL